MSGLAVGGAVNPALAASIIVKFGWSAGFYGLALVPLLIGFPIALLVVGDEPGKKHDAPAVFRGFDVGDALRTRVFWQLFFVFLIVAVCLHGIQLHLPAMISDRNLSPQVSATVLSLQFAVSAIVRICAGFLVDRIFAPRIGAMLFVLSALGAATLVPVGDPLFYLVGAALIGVGAGAETDLLTYLASRYFGLKAVGQIFGLIFSAFMIGSALGPYLFGVGYDVFHSYWLNLTLACAGLVLASILLMRLPKFPAEFARQPGPSTH
jgi:MFS family permease